MTKSENEESVGTTADLHKRLAAATRTLADASAVGGMIQRVATLAVHTVGPCEGASVSMRTNGDHEYAWSDDTFSRCAMLQHDLKQGPYFDLSDDEPIVVSGDLSTDTRWPRWTERMRTEFGVHSVLSVRLFIDAAEFGGLTLFSQHRNAFPASQKAGVVTYAAIASAALQSAHTRERLEEANESRTIIGQAQGVIMERFHVDAQEAFSMLKRVSKQANIHIRELADETITLREHPDAATRNPPRRG